MEPKRTVGDTFNDVRSWLSLCFHKINLAMIETPQTSQRLEWSGALDDMCRKACNNVGTHALVCLFLLKPVEYLVVRQNVLSGSWPRLLCTYISTCEIGCQKCRDLKPGDNLKNMLFQACSAVELIRRNS